MESFIYFFLETFIVGMMVLGLHASKKQFGIGMLFVFIGTMQFFQTILSGNVFNLFFNVFLFSPGSTLIFVTTLFSVLFIYRSESIIKVRSVIYGIIFSNIFLVFLSSISLEQIFNDSYSRNTIFLAKIFEFDIGYFVSGIVLLYLDMIFIIIIYKFIELKITSYYFIQLLISSIIISVFDSCCFYSYNFYYELNFIDLLIGNIAGKIIVCIILSILFSMYFLINPIKRSKRKKPLNINDLKKIINFTIKGKENKNTSELDL